MESSWEKPSVTVDIVIFTILEKTLKVLLVKRKIEPFRDRWAIPGGFVLAKEPLDRAAKRELEEETGVKDVYLEQLYTFGDPSRDPRGRVITVTYMALVDATKIQLHATTDVSDAQWFPFKKIPELAFDHEKILDYAVKRLQWKFEYTTVAFSLLPKEFTLNQLQTIYEIVFNRIFDKRNFTKKILALNILKKERVNKEVSHRPPMLYSLKKKIGDIIEII